MEEEPEFNLRASHYAIIQSSRPCWKCKRDALVVGFLLPPRHESLWIDDDREKDEWEDQDVSCLISSITHLVPTALTRIQLLSPHYAFGKTKDGGSYFVNSCAHCAAKQGDFHLYGKPGDAFFPLSEKGLARINISLVHEPFACNGNRIIVLPDMLGERAWPS